MPVRPASSSWTKAKRRSARTRGLSRLVVALRLQGAVLARLDRVAGGVGRHRRVLDVRDPVDQPLPLLRLQERLERLLLRRRGALLPLGVEVDVARPWVIADVDVVPVVAERER